MFTFFWSTLFIRGPSEEADIDDYKKSEEFYNIPLPDKGNFGGRLTE